MDAWHFCLVVSHLFLNLHFMKYTLQFGGNAVLQRELRASLRSARPFALIALYVAVLGAITLSQFPANQQISIDRAPSGLNAGKELFWTFVGMQALMVLLILPAIASGALSQEREQRTLESLLLTPLTPLQIVWGKAVGVLSLAGLLLLSTLPLTSLCFLLGGVSPGELVAAYSILMGLAVFTTSIGLYCSAKWTNTVKATLCCYALLPFFLAFMLLFSGVGIVMSAASLLAMLILALAKIANALGEKPSGGSTLAHRLGILWTVLRWLVLIVVGVGIVYFLMVDYDKSTVAFGIFGVMYLFFIAQVGLQQAAREIVRAPEPSAPSRQKMQDFQDEWREAMTLSANTAAPISTPAPMLAAPISSTATAATSPDAFVAITSTPAAPEAFAVPEVVALEAPTASTPAPAKTSRKDASKKDTYGVAPFLSDKLNPVFAKDMRSGLIGKFEYLIRFSYIAVIASEILLIFLVFALPAQSIADEWNWFSIWAKFHLVVVIIAGAWLGARSIAPEHEQQTLGQLVMTPLSAAQIVWGKVGAVLLYTTYIFMLGLPTALLLAGLEIVSWRGALSFLAIEIVFGALASAWGLYCSLSLVTVRRALAISLGGAFVLVVSSVLFDNLVISGFKLMMGRELISPDMTRLIGALLSPLQLLSLVLKPAASAARSTPALLQTALPVSLMFYSALTILLLLATMRGFRKYADSI